MTGTSSKLDMLLRQQLYTVDRELHLLRGRRRGILLCLNAATESASQPALSLVRARAGEPDAFPQSSSVLEFPLSHQS